MFVVAFLKKAFFFLAPSLCTGLNKPWIYLKKKTPNDLEFFLSWLPSLPSPLLLSLKRGVKDLNLNRTLGFPIYPPLRFFLVLAKERKRIGGGGGEGSSPLLSGQNKFRWATIFRLGSVIGFHRKEENFST
jgi:hypothetical protein